MVKKNPKNQANELLRYQHVPQETRTVSPMLSLEITMTWSYNTAELLYITIQHICACSPREEFVFIVFSA